MQNTLTINSHQVRGLPICVQKPLLALLRAPVSSTVIQPAVCRPARSTSRASVWNASCPAISSRITCRFEMLTPIARSCATNRGTVTCPWWYCASRKRRNSGPKWLVTPGGNGAITVRDPALAPIADDPRPQHQIPQHEVLVAFEASAGGHLRPEYLLFDDDLRHDLTPAAPRRAIARWLRRRSRFHTARLDLRPPLQSFEPRNLLAQLCDHALLFRTLAQSSSGNFMRKYRAF